MITFASQELPYTERVYIAFRIAFLETQERLALAEQLELESHRTFGFLTQVPFLRNVPAQVQLDLLLDTWDRHLAKAVSRATYLDEAILYAACETAANLIRAEPQHARRLLEVGPLPSSASLDDKLADQIQQMHLTFAGEGHFLLISQFQDLSPEEADPLKAAAGIINGRCDSLFDALGRWHVRQGFENRACGLLTEQEIERLSTLGDFTHIANRMNK